MRYMLDTNTCIFMLKHDLNVLSKFEKKRKDGMALSSIVLAELEYGVSNSQQYEKNRAALIAFLPLFELLPFGGKEAAIYGQICTALRREGNTIGPMDMMIAAHALSFGLTLVTNNIREFSRVPGLKIEDWR